MPHISSKELDNKYFKNIYNQLISVFDTAGNKRKSDALLKEILTETEKIMFAKRLAVNCMLYEEVSKTYISEILLLSPSTIDRLSMQYESGLYPYIANILKNNSKTIWNILEEMVHTSVSRKLGKKRLSWLDDIERKYNRKIFKT
ncbi:MAG: hypothetical protein HY507_01390 [Candidatus Zambryskibacteria bacterium]|nr:hypothetical protein [Candidatus Zambryskibacteria bacterium]